MATIASTTTTGTPVSPTGGMTLDALMLRQKELADRASTITAPRQMTSPWQGVAQLGQAFVNARQESTTADQLAAGRDQLAKLRAGINLDTGPTSQQISEAGTLDPAFSDTLLAMAYKSREEEKTRQATLAAEKLKTDAAGAWKPTDIGSLRDDYTKAAGTFTTANQSWNSMKQSAARALAPDASTEGKGAADYDMIVGWAKLLDPQSVVREGEVQSASMTGGMIGQLNGWLNTIRSKGSLDDATRRAIMTQAGSRMSAYYNEAKQKRDWITGIATRHQVNPDDVVAPLDEYQPFEEPKPDDPNNPDPNKPPAPPVDPSTLPSISGDQVDAFNKLPVGAQYTIPGDVDENGNLTVYVKKRQVAPAAGGP